MGDAEAWDLEDHEGREHDRVGRDRATHDERSMLESRSHPQMAQ